MEAVLLLNDDVEVHPRATAAALRVLDADPRVAVVGAKVLWREDPKLLWHWPRGSAGEVWLKIRGIRDALAGRRPPFEALGLR